MFLPKWHPALQEGQDSTAKIGGSTVLSTFVPSGGILPTHHFIPPNFWQNVGYTLLGKRDARPSPERCTSAGHFAQPCQHSTACSTIVNTMYRLRDRP